jgi:hypothetical protein
VLKDNIKRASKQIVAATGVGRRIAQSKHPEALQTYKEDGDKFGYALEHLRNLLKAASSNVPVSELCEAFNKLEEDEVAKPRLQLGAAMVRMRWAAEFESVLFHLNYWVNASGRRVLGDLPLSSSKKCRLTRTQNRLESGVHLNWLEREGGSSPPAY